MYCPRMVLPSRAIPVRKEAGRSNCALNLNNKHIENKKMKKTLIALLIAGSCAMGITLEDAAKTGTGNLTLDEATSAITAVAVVDVAKLQPLMAHNAELAKYTLINFDGGSDIGLQTNYGSHNHDSNDATPNVINTSGLWGCWNGSNAYSFGSSSNAGFENATFWEGGVTAAVTLTYEYSKGTSGTFTLLDAEGNVLQSVGGVRF